MNFMNCPKAIFFDFDGVIVNTETIYCKIILKYNKTTNIKISKDYYIHNFLGKTKHEISKILEEKYKDLYNEKKYWDGLISFREKYFNEHNIYLKKGFKRLFNYLKKNNYFVAIVSSNSISFIQKVLHNTSININDFDLIVTRENVQKTKPHPDLYEYAIKKSNVKINEAIAIEDSEVGIKSALNTHIKVIHIKDLSIIPSDLLSKCFLSVSSLNEVLTFLKTKGGNNGNN